MAKETNLEELVEMLAHVIKNMATKDDVEELRKELRLEMNDGSTGVNSKFDGVHR
jgi:hypothetical protein